jgi:hypothetical protein
MQITDGDIKSFLEDGFLVVPDALTPEEVELGMLDFYRNFPHPEDVLADASQFRHLDGYKQFPFPSDNLLRIVTKPEITSLVERIIGTSNLRLSLLDIWGKYGALNPGQDQILHIEGYGATSLTYPRTDGIYRQVLVFVYFSDVTKDSAPTYVVPQKHTREEFLVPPWRKPEEHPDIYSHEQPVLVKAGSIAVVDMSTFHRGSAIKSNEAYRFLALTSYHASDITWMRKQDSTDTDLGGYADQPSVRRFMETASPRQRQLLGFPAPGDQYWNTQTLAGVSARYPGMDMTPYQEAVQK